MRTVFAVITLLVAATANAEPPAPVVDSVRPEPRPTDKLFRQFGGEAALKTTVDAFTRIALDDPRIAHTFEETNIPRFKGKLYDQLCELMGGPCVYDGFGMRESHEPLDIGHAEFGAMVEDFQTAMSEADVPFRIQNKLLKIIAPMKRDIVVE
ncbi:MAG: group 1 truncated hemoglobin [Parvularculaceae bacterium]